MILLLKQRKMWDFEVSYENHVRMAFHSIRQFLVQKAEFKIHFPSLERTKKTAPNNKIQKCCL